MPTEREAVLREREAADAAIKAVFSDARRSGGIETCDFRTWAADHYPLPTVMRPRVVKDDNGLLYRYDESLAVCPACDVGSSREYWCGPVAVHPGNRALIADLLANPTEEVEAES